MFSRLFIIIPLMFGFTQLSVNWIHKNRGILSLHVTEHDPIMMECQKSGSEVYYRYEYQLCRHRTLWLDSCESTRVITRTLNWDPISDNYAIVSDILGDKQPASKSTFTTSREALEELSTVKEVSLKDFTKVEPGEKHRFYLRARVKFICKGQTSATLDRISSIMTLGLVNLGTADSGWIDFPLESEK